MFPVTARMAAESACVLCKPVWGQVASIAGRATQKNGTVLT